MKNIAVQVTFKDGDVVSAVVYPETQAVFEQRFDRPFLASFSAPENVWVAWLLFIGWHASGAAAPFDVWVRAVETIDLGSVDPEG